MPAATSHRIAVVGAGSIGGTLARRLAGAGADVRVGVRAGSGGAAELTDVAVTPVGEAIAASDVVIVAIPGASVAAFLAEWGPAIGSRVALDTTNNLSGGTVLHSLPLWREHAPAARVYRAFCSSGWETFADPDFGGVQADVFYCGPDGPGQAIAEEVIAAVGLRPVRLGDESVADLLDALARLWFQLAFQAGRGRDVTLKLLERP